MQIAYLLWIQLVCKICYVVLRLLICSGSCHSLHLVNAAPVLWIYAHSITLLLKQFHSISLNSTQFWVCATSICSFARRKIPLNCKVHFCCILMLQLQHSLLVANAPFSPNQWLILRQESQVCTCCCTSRTSG